MNKYISISLILTVLVSGLTSCMSSVQITSVVEKNKKGNYLVKWEVSPDQEGDIQIYSSLSDTSINSFVPVTTAKINEQFAVLNPTGSGIRQFFFLKTAGAISGIISNRIIDMDNIYNFRDLGGYYTTDNKQMRWGKIYRSGDLSKGSLFDYDKIFSLGIKTIIDLRTNPFAIVNPILIKQGMNYISLPIVPGDTKEMIEQVQKEKITRSDAVIFMQDGYTRILDDYKNELRKVFDVLSDENNYPVLVSSILGKDRVGVVSYLILYAVGIPEYIIEDDYMLSNDNLNPRNYIDFTQMMSEPTQEAITALLSVNKAYINYATEHLKKKYGSVNNYLTKELGLTPKKRESLRKILLYQR